MTRTFRSFVALVALSFVAVACAGGGSEAPSPTDPVTDDAATGTSAGTTLDPASLVVQVASTDLYVDEPQRVNVGVYASDPQTGINLVVGGEIAVTLAPFEDGPGSPSEATARYLPAPGTEVPAEPSLSPPSESRGVYALGDVTFDAPGIWEATATFTVEGQGPFEVASTPFNVLEEPAYPAPGDRALEAENLTIGSDAPPEAIDSGAATTGEVPDPELHEWTIADALDERRPIVALFATPAYCESLFCGPVTDSVRDLAAAYDDRAVFVHVEIWRENPTVLNEAAAEWLYRDENLTEPWLFLIDARGTIVDRWGPLWDPDEVAAYLDELPPMS